MSRLANIGFLIVFIYTICALVFWHSSLQKQNKILVTKELQIAKLQNNTSEEYVANVVKINEKYRRKKVQYYGEGGTFLLFIVVGGVIVYFSFRKRLQLSSQQNNFMMSITHELKSPLAGIKLGLETIKKRVLNDEQKNQIIHNSIYETNRLDELCNNILLSTQLDGKQYNGQIESFDLVALINDTVNTFKFRYPDIEWVFHSYTKNKLFTGDQFLIGFAINNLLENAIKYAPESKMIVTDLYQTANNLIIQIIDQGKGISETDKKKIFQKFYRVGNENVRKSRGTGLGLFIVKNAVERHNGTIEMLNNNPNGNIANITIPLNDE
jgi:K+-sensing histidine kinase KdpD